MASHSMNVDEPGDILKKDSRRIRIWGRTHKSNLKAMLFQLAKTGKSMIYMCCWSLKIILRHPQDDTKPLRTQDLVWSRYKCWRRSRGPCHGLGRLRYVHPMVRCTLVMALLPWFKSRRDTISWWPDVWDRTEHAENLGRRFPDCILKGIRFHRLPSACRCRNCKPRWHAWMHGSFPRHTIARFIIRRVVVSCFRWDPFGVNIYRLCCSSNWK